MTLLTLAEGDKAPLTGRAPNAVGRLNEFWGRASFVAVPPDDRLARQTRASGREGEITDEGPDGH